MCFYAEEREGRPKDERVPAELATWHLSCESIKNFQRRKMYVQAKNTYFVAKLHKH